MAARILQLPRIASPDPVLLIRTFGRADCFSLCARCLERFTDMARFSRVYVLAGEARPVHATLVEDFLARRERAELLRCTPGPGDADGVRGFESVLARHADDILVSLDENVFVTPGWLPKLLAAHRTSLGRPGVPVVQPLIAQGVLGRRLLAGFLAANYPSSWKHGCAGDEGVYHDWIWSKVLAGDFAGRWACAARLPQAYAEEPDSGLLLYDTRFAQRLLRALPKAGKGGRGEPAHAAPYYPAAVRDAFAESDLSAVVVTGLLAHRFGGPDAPAPERSQVCLTMVRDYLDHLADAAGALGARRIGHAASLP